MTARRLKIVISGKVQGVWFRAAARDAATRLGLRGWVRNLPDGRVEALCEGEEQALAHMLDWCRVGPPGARVLNVEAQWAEPSNEFAGFSIRY